MSPTVIDLHDVWLHYRIPEEQVRSIKEFVIRRAQGNLRMSSFWALQGISLQVHAGEVLGIVGKNGAGKSTLMKVISRILRPTRGRVRVWGRVAPLLALGAGFHDELTGRENVYLASAILGFSREDVARRFDRIVAFAELEHCIDRPLRTYSSGMRARLGFAVAADVLPDILILDEILAVGDAAFQQKCRERIKNFRQTGATILVVSHQPQTLASLCTRAILLDSGKLVAEGGTAQVLEEYRKLLAHPGAAPQGSPAAQGSTTR